MGVGLESENNKGCSLAESGYLVSSPLLNCYYLIHETAARSRWEDGIVSVERCPAEEILVHKRCKKYLGISPICQFSQFPTKMGRILYLLLNLTMEVSDHLLHTDCCKISPTRTRVQS